MEDCLLGGRVRLTQPEHGYRVAIDPVLLAASVAPAPGERILDAGCGTAAAALCLAVRTDMGTIVGVERDAELAHLARLNVAANALSARIALAETDFRSFAAAHRGAFDQVMTNPPFLPAGTHTPSPHLTRAAAHGEGALDLAGWIAAATTALKPRGRLTLIHRADCLADLLAALDGRFGAVAIFPLWPKRAHRPSG